MKVQLIKANEVRTVAGGSGIEGRLGVMYVREDTGDPYVWNPVAKTMVPVARVSGGALLGDAVYSFTSVWTPTSFTQAIAAPVLTGVYDFAGIKFRAITGTVNLTLYDALSATGTAIDTITAASLGGGPGSNGFYPILSSNAARRLSTGLFVTVSGGGTFTADALSGS